MVLPATKRVKLNSLTSARRYPAIRRVFFVINLTIGYNSRVCLWQPQGLCASWLKSHRRKPIFIGYVKTFCFRTTGTGRVKEIQDKQLRARVKLLGTLLGNVVRQQAGEAVYEAVERLRQGYISLRKQDDPALRQSLNDFIAELDADTMTHVIRAFNIYFGLANLAEEEGAFHRRQHQMREEGPLWLGSFMTSIGELKAEGISAEQMNELVQGLMYRPVFTAHPTESKRRAVMENLREVFVTLEDLVFDERRNDWNDPEIINRLQTQIQVL